MTETDTLATELFDHAIVRALEEAPHKKMKLGELRINAHFRRGIIEQVQSMKIRGLLLIFAEGEIDMRTEVSLGCG